MPTLYDCSGSSDFRNQTHNGYTIYRIFESQNTEGSTLFVNQKTKFDFQGKIGESVSFKYDVPSKRYYVEGSNCSFDMTKKQQEHEEYDFKMMPNDKFDTPF